MSNKLFNILDGIIASEYACETLADTDQIVNYAEGCGETITYADADRIQNIGQEWAKKVENGGEWSMYREDTRQALEDDAQ